MQTCVCVCECECNTVVQAHAGKRLSFVTGKGFSFTFGYAAVAWSESRKQTVINVTHTQTPGTQAHIYILERTLYPVCSGRCCPCRCGPAPLGSLWGCRCDCSCGLKPESREAFLIYSFFHLFSHFFKSLVRILFNNIKNCEQSEQSLRSGKRSPGL